MVRSNGLFREERLELIVHKLVQEKKVYVTDLAKDFDISSSSIRNDLTELESRGLLVRTYGGAILPEKLNHSLITQKSVLQLRENVLREEKNAIGKAAASLVNDGDTIMIDGGSTTGHVIRHLGDKRGLTIVTNATSLLSDLQALGDAEIYLSGGLLHTGFATLFGEIANDVLGQFHTSKAILGMDGISLKSGLTATNSFVAASKRRMIASAQSLIVVCDHTKFDRVCLMPIATLDEMDCLVTDMDAPEEIVEAIRERGPRVITAAVESV